MRSILTPSGVTVVVTGDVRILSTLRTVPSANRRGRHRAVAPSPDRGAEIVTAMGQQDLEFLAGIPLQVGGPAAAVAARRGKARRGAQAGPPIVELTVPLIEGDQAVVLLEQDGVFTWHLRGEEVSTAPAQTEGGRPRRRSARDTASTDGARRAVRFSLPLRPIIAVTDIPKGRSARRGLGQIVGGVIAGRVLARIFRFAARRIVGPVIAHMERHVRTGLVQVATVDRTGWRLLEDAEQVTLPTDRPARVLLLVHGTFSSTDGSFGGLAETPYGRDVLAAMLRRYDVVLGFDHATLSVDPRANASAMLARLERQHWPHPPIVDAVAYSRGGLVFRSLVEFGLPNSRFAMSVGRAVFVACTNGGTELARSRNWGQFVDQYTNLAAAATHAIALIPGAGTAAGLLGAGIRGIGALVKALATRSLDQSGVPGLEAMDPSGSFVKTINEEQKGQPRPEQTYYCAITSNFDPYRAQRNGTAPEFGPGWYLYLADKPVDKIIGKDNDLVVNVDSMTCIDPGVGGFIKERFDYGSNGVVYHCNYFLQPRTVQQLTRWLRLDIPTAQVPNPRATGGRGSREPSGAQHFYGKAPAVRVGRSNRPDPGGSATTDFEVLGSDLPTDVAVRLIKKSTSPWFAIRGEASVDARRFYAFRREELLPRLTGRPGPIVVTLPGSLHQSLDLHNTRSSHEVGVGQWVIPKMRSPGLKNFRRSAGRAVVIHGTEPIGIVPTSDDLLEASRVAASAPPASHGRAAAVSGGLGSPVGIPMGLGVRRGTGATRPVKFGSGSRPRRPGASTVPARGMCHFRAEVEEELVLGADLPTFVEVTIAREALTHAKGRVGSVGKASVEKNKQLIVELIPKANIKAAVSTSTRIEIDVPKQDKPVTLLFGVRATSPGGGEIWVQIRQGPAPLATLKLLVQIVDKRTGTPRHVRAVADIPRLPPTPAAVDELRIIQRLNGAQTSYSFELGLPSRRIRRTFDSVPLDSEPAAYIAALYKEIEDRWSESGAEAYAFARDLRAIGSRLWRDLIPVELQQLLWQHRDAIKSVQVLSTEPFVPWELVLLRSPAKNAGSPQDRFLGEFGVVRWLLDGYPPEAVRVRKGKARYVIPDYTGTEHAVLECAQMEKHYVRKHFEANEVEPSAAAVYRVLASGNFDLLHVACHGSAESADINAAKLIMPGRLRGDGTQSDESVRATTVSDISMSEIDARSRPIVVLNACQSARAGYQLRGMGGFAQAFVHAGAGVFVGTHWSVGDAQASTFITRFYESFLLDGRRSSLSEATATARKAAKRKGDATWLAFVVYGHPRARAIAI